MVSEYGILTEMRFKRLRCDELSYSVQQENEMKKEREREAREEFLCVWVESTIPYVSYNLILH